MSDTDDHKELLEYHGKEGLLLMAAFCQFVDRGEAVPRDLLGYLAEHFKQALALDRMDYEQSEAYYRDMAQALGFSMPGGVTRDPEAADRKARAMSEAFRQIGAGSKREQAFASVAREYGLSSASIQRSYDKYRRLVELFESF